MRRRDTTITAWDNYKGYSIDYVIPKENPDDTAAETSTTIHVIPADNILDKSVFTDEFIKAEFSQYGEIESVKLENKRYKIQFKTHESAIQAINEPEKQLMEKKFNLEVSSGRFSFIYLSYFFTFDAALNLKPVPKSDNNRICKINVFLSTQMQK